MILEKLIFISFFSFVFSPFVFYLHIFCFHFCTALKILFLLHNNSFQYPYLLYFHLCNLRINLFSFYFENDVIVSLDTIYTSSWLDSFLIDVLNFFLSRTLAEKFVLNFKWNRAYISFFSFLKPVVESFEYDVKP